MTVMAELDSFTVITISAGISMLFTVLGGILGAVWKITNFLRDKFNEVEHQLEDLLNTHEAKDQDRHEDNIKKFAKIETQLETIIKNGHTST